MKYIIIGVAILYITFPSFIAIPMADDIRELPSEWWDAFKSFAPIATAIIATVVAMWLVIYGLTIWGAV